MLINYFIEKGCQINGIYSDEDYSGADANLPAWNQVLRDCEEGKCSIVVCKTQSRFLRDMEIIEKYIHGKFLEWEYALSVWLTMPIQALREIKKPDR